MSAAPLHMISKHRSNGPINYGSTIIPWTQTKPVWLTSLHRQTEDPTLKHCAMVFFQSLLGQTTRFFPLVLVSFVLASFWGLLPNPYWCLKPCFSHECHANVLTDICPFETNWCIDLQHYVSKSSVHFAIHHMQLFRIYQNVPAICLMPLAFHSLLWETP